VNGIKMNALSEVLAVHIPSPDPASATVACTDCPSGRAHGWFRGWTAWRAHIVEAVSAAGLDVAPRTEPESKLTDGGFI